MFLTELSVKRPIATAMAVLAVCLGGFIGLFYLPVDMMPNAESSQVTIYVGVRGGMPSQDIEQLVAEPIEEAVATMPGLDEITSTSRKDRCTVTLMFKNTDDVKRATLDVSERLARIKGKLPKEIEKPIVARYNENDHPIVILSATSSVKTPEMMRTMVERDLKPLLSRVPGVGNVEIYGGRQRKILVEFEKAKLEAHRIAILEVIRQLGSNNLSVSSGKFDVGRDAWSVQVDSDFNSLEEMKQLGIALTREGSRIRLGDVATVRDYYLEAESYARINNQPSVSIHVQKESGANTIKAARGVLAEVGKYQASLPGDIGIGVSMDQSVAINEAIGNLKKHLFYGALLTAGVLFFFFTRTKQVSVIITSIPIAVMGTFFVMTAHAAFMERTGRAPLFTINVMSLLGIALGIGRMVDDAIVVFENILHRFEEARRTGQTFDKMKVALAATKEMALPVASSTLILIVVFVPIVFFSEDVRRQFADVAFTVIVSLLASLVMAVTLVPLLATRLRLMKEEDGSDMYPWEKKVVAYFDRKVTQAPWRQRLRASLQVPRAPATLRLWSIIWSAVLIAYLASCWQFSKDVWPWVPPLAIWLIGSPFLLQAYQGAYIKLAYFSGLFFVALVGSGYAYWSFREHMTVAEIFTFLFSMGVPLLFLVYRGMFGPFLRRATSWSVRNRGWVMAGVLATTVCSALFYNALPKEFLGGGQKDEFIIFIELPSGSKLDVSDKVVASVENEINQLPEVKNVIKTVSARVEGWSSKIYVTLAPGFERTRSADQIIDDLRPRVASLGAEYDAFIYFSEASSAKDLTIDLFGKDYLQLRDMAVEAAKRMQEVAGLRDVKLRYKEGQPEIRLQVDHQRASMFGLNSREIADTIHADIRGLRATYFNAGSEQVETVARLSEEDRRTVENLNDLTIIANVGKTKQIVPVLQVLDFKTGLTPSEVWRRNKERVIQVSANRDKLPLSEAVSQVKEQLKGMPVPIGYHYEFGGDYKKLVKSEKEFIYAFIVMFALVYMVLACFFESYTQPALMLLTIPLATVGSLPTLWLAGVSINMGVYMGLLMLGGTVTSNAVILIDRLNIVRESRSLLRSVLKAGSERARPIFMTSLSTIAAMLPLTLEKGESAELWAPLALTVVSGIALSSVLTLAVIPAAYVMMDVSLRNLSRWTRGEVKLKQLTREIVHRQTPANRPALRTVVHH